MTATLIPRVPRGLLTGRDMDAGGILRGDGATPLRMTG